MIWKHTYTPFNNMVISTLLAAIPVVVMLACLGFFHIKAHIRHRPGPDRGDLGRRLRLWHADGHGRPGGGVWGIYGSVADWLDCAEHYLFAAAR